MPSNILVCAVGQAHAARPAQDQQTSECHRPNQGSSLDGATHAYRAPLEKSTTPRLPTLQLREREDWCPSQRTQNAQVPSGQRAPRPRVESAAERVLLLEGTRR